MLSRVYLRSSLQGLLKTIGKWMWWAVIFLAPFHGVFEKARVAQPFQLLSTMYCHFFTPLYNDSQKARIMQYCFLLLPSIMGTPKRQGLCNHSDSSPPLGPHEGRGYVATLIPPH